MSDTKLKKPSDKLKNEVRSMLVNGLAFKMSMLESMIIYTQHSKGLSDDETQKLRERAILKLIETERKRIRES